MLLNIVTIVAVLWPCTVSGTVMVYSDSLPESLTTTCSAALLTDVACDPLVRNLRPDFFYPPESLSRICTPGCSGALSSWLSSVKSACGNQTIVADLEVQAAAAIIPGSLDYLLQFTCLRESDRYCGPVAALAAFFDDPGVSMFNYISEIPAGAARPSECDACLAERLRVRAGSPYFDGPIVASESQYQSMTSSCNIDGKPVTATTIDYFTAEPQPTQSVCDGSTYSVRPEDNCNSIAKSQGVATAWLLADNNLGAYCTDFPSSGTLCITNQCATVTVGVNATCSAIAAANNITETQFRAWNPIINTPCSNLPALEGTEICVDAPGRKFVPPTGTVPPLTPTVPAPLPTDTAEGSNKPCSQWYEVQLGDFCNALTLKFGISLVDFLFLNSGINANCTNLFANESYCVRAVGDINTYLGRPGHNPVTIDPSATFTGIPFTGLPDATATPFSRYTLLPTATGTRDDCVHYFNGEDYQMDVKGTSWASACALAAYMYDIDLEDFGTWNPSLGDVNAPSCAFQSGVRYCGSWYLQTPVVTNVVSSTTSTSDSGSETGPPKPSPPAPTHSGQPSDCNKWDVVNDGDNCDNMASAAGISRAQFLAYNPAVNQDCTQNFWLGYAYCVGVAGAGTVTPPPSTTTKIISTSTEVSKPTPPAPTHSGQPANCDKWDVVNDGDNCDNMASAAGISRAQFLAYNPAVSQDCTQNFWLGYAYCVGVPGGSPGTPPPATTKPPSTGPTKPPAQYLQEGQPDNCSKWDRAVSGDYCGKIAERNGLSVSQFAKFNPALGTDGKDCGTMIWLDYYYCVAT